MVSSAGGAQDDHREADIAQFRDVTEASGEQARFYLEASDWRFDRAVAMFYESSHDPAAAATEEFEPAVQYTTTSLLGRQPPPQRGGHQGRGLFGMLLALPRAILQTSFGIVFTTVGISASLVAFLGSRIISAPILRNFRGRLLSLTQGSEPADPQSSAAAFIHSFASQYGGVRPMWRQSSWSDAARLAHSQFKFLFVYLHSPAHQDADNFCRGTLCNVDVADYVNQNFVCWGGSINTPDAFQLATSLQVTSYPYTALLAFSGPRTRLIAFAEGSHTSQQLLPMLQEAQEQHSIHLVAEQAEHNERNYNRRLREEQDAEYQRSLAADRERERQREEAAQAKLAAQRATEEAAAKKKTEKDAERRAEEERISTLAKRREAKLASLGPEPAAGDVGAVQIRVRMPDSTNHQRRFLASDALQKAYDFVDTLEGLSSIRYSLASSYPRRVFAGEMLRQSFQDLGLTPQALLFVQPDDD